MVTLAPAAQACPEINDADSRRSALAVAKTLRSMVPPGIRTAHTTRELTSPHRKVATLATYRGLHEVTSPGKGWRGHSPANAIVTAG
ncbi:hypothetical protein GCM10009789_65920 [Kribbella sancticallisti]|uniref:Uncharacterized protein n=1 Tax=Kribbella sancticallisti TaxID=460087 RepID=A0ABP4QAK6_9ACTN